MMKPVKVKKNKSRKRISRGDDDGDFADDEEVEISTDRGS